MAAGAIQVCVLEGIHVKMTELGLPLSLAVELTDYFSKWAEAAALPDKTAKGVAKFIYSMVSLKCKCQNKS